MTQPVRETEISLKILVDVKSKKVVFAEAGKDFVDFIFHIMSLPLSTVTKLLMDDNNAGGMVGSLGALAKSIESLDGKYYESNINKGLVLNEKSITLYRCATHPTYVWNNGQGIFCPGCCYRETTLSPFSITYKHPTTLMDYKTTTPTGFVRGVVPYMVMDNLEVKPMSLTLIRSLVKNFDYFEEKQVQFGLQQGLALLKASLETQAVLTTVFLKNTKI